MRLPRLTTFLFRLDRSISSVRPRWFRETHSQFDGVCRIEQSSIDDDNDLAEHAEPFESSPTFIAAVTTLDELLPHRLRTHRPVLRLPLPVDNLAPTGSARPF